MKQVDILDRVLSLEELPMRPETAAQLLAFHDELVDGYRLRRLLAADPALLFCAARLSGAHAADRVPTIDELARVARTSAFWRHLAGVVSVYRPNKSGHLPLVRAWRFSLATASAARALIRPEAHESSARAFTAGWYRTLGAYVLAVLEGERWEELRSQALSYEHLLELEKETFGLSQHELAIHLLVHWGLSVEPLVEMRRRANGNGQHTSLSQLTADAIRLVQDTPLALCACPLPADARRLQELAWLERAVAQVEQFLTEPRRGRVGDRGDWLVRGARLAADAVARRTASAWRVHLERAARGGTEERFPADLARAVAQALREAASVDVVCAVALAREGRSSVAIAPSAGSVRIHHVSSVLDNHSRLRAVLSSIRCYPSKHGWIERNLLHQPHATVLVLLDANAAAVVGQLGDVLRELAHCAQAAVARYHEEKQRREVLCDLHEAQATASRIIEERVLEAIGEFAAGAAHELNNRIAVIRGRAQLLLEGEQEAARLRALETILQETRRVREILQKLYDLAQPAEPEFERVEPLEVVHEAVDRLRRELTGAGECCVEIEAADQALRVQADPEMLREALYELIRNAVEAGQGPVRIAVRATARNAVVVRIMNQATMDQRLQRLAWVPFYSGREAGRGVGLGLPLARRLVEAQGGRLRLYSAAAGTVVDVILPMPPASGGQRRCA